MKTTLDPHSHAGAGAERLVYTCPACGVAYDAAPGEAAPECECDEATITRGSDDDMMAYQ